MAGKEVLCEATLHKLRPLDNAERSDDHNFLICVLQTINYFTKIQPEHIYLKNTQQLPPPL